MRGAAGVLDAHNSAGLPDRYRAFHRVSLTIHCNSAKSKITALLWELRADRQQPRRGICCSLRNGVVDHLLAAELAPADCERATDCMTAVLAKAAAHRSLDITGFGRSMVCLTESAGHCIPAKAVSNDVIMAGSDLGNCRRK